MNRQRNAGGLTDASLLLRCQGQREAFQAYLEYARNLGFKDRRCKVVVG